MFGSKKKGKSPARKTLNLELDSTHYWYLKRAALARSEAEGRQVSVRALLGRILAKAMAEEEQS